MDRGAHAEAPSNVTVFVCRSCGADADGMCVGEALLDTLNQCNEPHSNITITGVECLAVCERPVTLSFAATGKWTYVIGDVTADTPPQDILSAARAVAASPYGVPEMADRPAFFRDGVVSRTPPAGWEMPA